MGACDVGNRFSWLTPFWMGVADVLLKQHANAVVVSRWKLEEETIDIYLDFYRRVRQGTSLDVALTQAKRRFRAGSTRTGSAPSSGRHPFYWAGLTYVGPPGMVLYPVRRPPPFFWILLTIKILWVLVVWRQTASAKGGTANPNGVASKQPESVSPW